MKYSKEGSGVAVEELVQAKKKVAEFEEESARRAVKGKGNVVSRARFAIGKRFAVADAQSKEKKAKKLVGLGEIEAHAYNENLNKQAESISTDVQQLLTFFETNDIHLPRIHEGVLDGEIKTNIAGYPEDFEDGAYFQQEHVFRTDIASGVESLLSVLKENYYNPGFIEKHYNVIRTGLLEDIKAKILKDIEERVRNGSSKSVESHLYLSYSPKRTIDQLAEEDLKRYESGQEGPLHSIYRIEWPSQQEFKREFEKMIQDKTRELFPLPESYRKLEVLGKIIDMDIPLTPENADIKAVTDATKELKEVIKNWAILKRPEDK